MRKTVYVKYSNERDDRFKIKTIIEQDEEGKRYVKKYALTEEARAHIEKIAEHHKQLESHSEETSFFFNPCVVRDGYVDCEYINGDSLSSILKKKMGQSLFLCA